MTYPLLTIALLSWLAWPGMFRLVRDDGTLSDVINLTRAKAALLNGGGLR